MKWIIRIDRILIFGLISAVFCEKKSPEEIKGRVCAFGDFNADRNTDILISDGTNLTIRLQETKLIQVLDPPKFINSTSWKVWEYDLEDKVECSVGDFNGDSRLDVLVSIRLGEDEYNHTVWISSDDLNGMEVFVPIRVGTLMQHAIAVDVTNDGSYDIIGFYPNGSFYCSRVGKNGIINPIVDSCVSDFKSFPETTNVYKGMPHLFVDVNSDLRADLVFMTKDDDGSLAMSVWQQRKTGWFYTKWIPKLSSVQYMYIGAPIVMDYDADAEIDILVPICRESTCRHVTSLASYSFNRGWSTVAIDLQDLEVQSEPNSLVLFRVGDFSMDGYPDLIAILDSNQAKIVPAAKVVENVECKNCEKNGTRKFEIKKTDFIQTREMAVGKMKMSTFFDLLEDGNLDVLVEYESVGSTRIGFFHCSDKGDTTFLKVQVFTGVCSDRCNPKSNEIGSSISMAGACASFSMSDGWGGSTQSIACQVPSSSHRSLFLPFLLYGLGRSPNFVDELTIGIPKYVDRKDDWRHSLKQIVPNSRIIVLPPTEENSHWTSRLYVTPSTLIFQSFAVIASVCVMLLSVIVFLHYRERKEDRYERQQQSHRFHFDAM